MASWLDVDGLCPAAVRDEIAVMALQVAGGFEWDRNRAKYLLKSIDRLIEAGRDHLVSTIGEERADLAIEHLTDLVWAVTGYMDLFTAIDETTEEGADALLK